MHGHRFLTERFEENMEILQSKFTNTVINAQSKKIEEQILEVVNAVSVTPKSTQEVQDK